MKTINLLSEDEFMKLCISSLGSLGAKRHLASTVTSVWNLYGESSRIYHDKLHILHAVSWVVEKIKSDPGLHISKPRLIIALLYHDTICIPGSGTNEEESNQMMIRDLTRMGVIDTEITQISIDILDTKHKDVPKTEEGKCMVDADISGFTLPIDDVWADTVKLFSESGKDMITFSRCIRAFLQTLLVRSSIYQSAYMTEEEAIARENISEIVERLNAIISRR